MARNRNAARAQSIERKGLECEPTASSLYLGISGVSFLIPKLTNYHRAPLRYYPNNWLGGTAHVARIVIADGRIYCSRGAAFRT